MIEKSDDGTLSRGETAVVANRALNIFVGHPLSVLYHCLVVGTLVQIPGMLQGIPVWHLSFAELGSSVLLASGYLLGALIFEVRACVAQQRRLAAIAILAGYCLPYLYVILLERQVSRLALLGTFIVAVGSMLIRAWIPRREIASVVQSVALAAATVVAATGGVSKPSLPTSVAIGTVHTGFYAVHALSYQNIVPRGATYFRGGALALVRDEVLITTGDGDMYVVALSDVGGAEPPRPMRLDSKAPLNREELIRADGLSEYTQWFRVLDAAHHESEDGADAIFVSHHFWVAEDSCFVVRVSRIDYDALSSGAGEWEHVFDSSPCLPLVTEESWSFRGMEGGGRLAFLGDRELLLTVGDHGFNGFDFPNEPNLVEQDSASYGKTVLVDLESGESRVFTKGHRNPQGLLYDPDTDVVWSTEHGPRGGDELNILREGRHYGWPNVTYGTNYGERRWPPSEEQGRHSGYAQPVFSWVPSIGASNLVKVEGSRFPNWDGDLLVGSMVANTLYRVHVTDGRAVVVEPIPMDGRIRDLIQLPDGRLLLWMDSGSLIVLSREPA